MNDDRLINAEKRGEDEGSDLETSLRPQVLDDFIGQAAARANLKVFIQAARQREERGTGRRRFGLARQHWPQLGDMLAQRPAIGRVAIGLGRQDEVRVDERP